MRLLLLLLLSLLLLLLLLLRRVPLLHVRRRGVAGARLVEQRRVPGRRRRGGGAALDAVLRQLVAHQAVGVGEGFAADLAAERLLQADAAAVRRLLVRRQVEVVAERLPAHGAGVEPRRRRAGRRGLVALGARREVVGVPRGGGLGEGGGGGGGGGALDAAALAVDLALAVQLAVPHQALGFFWPECTVRCLVRWNGSRNVLPHTSQACGFSPVCTRLWRRSVSARRKRLRQIWQPYGRSLPSPGGAGLRLLRTAWPGSRLSRGFLGRLACGRPGCVSGTVAPSDDGPPMLPNPKPPSRPPMMSRRSPSRPSVLMSQEAAAAAAMADMALLGGEGEVRLLRRRVVVVVVVVVRRRRLLALGVGVGVGVGVEVIAAPSFGFTSLLDPPAPPILDPPAPPPLTRFFEVRGGLPQAPEAAWLRSDVLSRKQRPHAGQRKGFSSWIFSCRVSDSRRLKDFWQTAQANGRFSECVTLCWMRWPRFLKRLPHSPQQNTRSGLGEPQSDLRPWLSGVSPWLRRWRRRLERCVKSGSGSGRPDEASPRPSGLDLDAGRLPLATSTEAELEEGGAEEEEEEEEEETAEDDCCEDDDRWAECGGSPPMPTPPEAPPTRPDDELWPRPPVARHRLLPPAAAAGGRGRRAVAGLGVVLGERQVQRQRQRQAGLLLHERGQLVGGEHRDALEVEAAQRGGLRRRVQRVGVVGVAVRLLLLLLGGRSRVAVAVRGVERRGRSQGRVGLGARAQAQAQVVVRPLLHEELLQAAVGGNAGQEVLVGGEHAAELLVEAAGVRLADEGHRGAARGVVGGGGGGRRGHRGGGAGGGLRDGETRVQRRRRRRGRDDPADDPRAAAAPAKVKAAHPRVELLLGQRRLGRVERPQELGVARGAAAPPAAATAAHLAGLPGAVGRGRRLALVGDGRRRRRGAHLGEQRRRVGEGVAPGALQGPEAEARQEPPGAVRRGLVLLLQLLLVLQLHLLLVAQLALQAQPLELVRLVAAQHLQDVHGVFAELEHVRRRSGPPRVRRTGSQSDGKPTLLRSASEPPEPVGAAGCSHGKSSYDGYVCVHKAHKHGRGSAPRESGGTCYPVGFGALFFTRGETPRKARFSIGGCSTQKLVPPVRSGPVVCRQLVSPLRFTEWNVAVPPLLLPSALETTDPSDAARGKMVVSCPHNGSGVESPSTGRSVGGWGRREVGLSGAGAEERSVCPGLEPKRGRSVRGWSRRESRPSCPNMTTY
ncbi:hypothetical protein EYF80_048082 [Liparis tanakae]|uniref:Uncharacterized protein n=1 Tax=Liparis tanakae TaxID=230148 RepID=A0A4Z2FKI5_9TELE|nr:hypothetical protein EYF80_048082 [Liparis tanakae]